MKQKSYIAILLALLLFGCDTKDQASAKNTSSKTDYTLPSGKAIYIPQDLKSNDFTKKDSQWSYYRMAYSDNWVLFWEKGFGNDPSTLTDSKMNVNINDLLAKAEQFFSLNVDKLKFVTKGSSNTDKYRMMIFLKYQTDWLATGSGYDDVIGSLWVNPSTCQPVGSVIAHEVGHCFQYQVYCDHPEGDPGYRYGYGENASGGNAFWEQCAQWQSFQYYPTEQFTNYDFPTYLTNCHKNILHEEPRYSNYFIQSYWCMKHGIDFIGKLWREARKPEDPIETYQRINNITQEQFNNEIFDAAIHFVNWDLDLLREYGKNYIGRTQSKLVDLNDNYVAIDSSQCIENYGYNVISLDLPTSGTKINAHLIGLAGTEGYRKLNVDKAGWRYGYVAHMKDGSSQYSNVYSEKIGDAPFTCPEGCDHLYFVVSGAPTLHWHHAWDDNDKNDEQWPYKVKFTGCDVTGHFTIDPSTKPGNSTISANLTIPYSLTEYSSKSVNIDTKKVCQALVLYPNEIRSKWGNEIQFIGINNNDTYAYQSTAQDPGHWFDSDGNVCSWGENAKIFSEFNKDDFSFKIGLYPGHVKTGESYTIKQALLYKYSSNNILITFIFKINIE